ncbi:hypothetical protein TNCV_3661771 [Trichonephila clavipes]|nr:hypothetical protein TNCV_3661771 [Trichonephila clavipes]
MTSPRQREDFEPRLFQHASNSTRRVFSGTRFRIRNLTTPATNLRTRTLGYPSRRDDTGADTPFLKLPHHAIVKTLSHDKFIVHWSLYTQCFQWHLNSNL